MRSSFSFCSQDATACLIYTEQMGGSGRTGSLLITSKTSLAPLRGLTATMLVSSRYPKLQSRSLLRLLQLPIERHDTWIQR